MSTLTLALAYWKASEALRHTAAQGFWRFRRERQRDRFHEALVNRMWQETMERHFRRKRQRDWLHEALVNRMWREAMRQARA